MVSVYKYAKYVSVAVTVVRGGTINRRRISTKAEQELEAMDNLSNMSTMVPDRNSSSYMSPLSGPGFVVFNMVLLVVVVLPMVVLNGVVLLALLLETSTARVVRLALGSILVLETSTARVVRLALGSILVLETSTARVVRLALGSILVLETSTARVVRLALGSILVLETSTARVVRLALGSILVLETSTAWVVRLALGSILVSYLTVALGLVMYHISGVVFNLAPVDNLSSIPCTITVFLIAFGSTARLVFMAKFAVTVYTVVKHSFAAKRRAGYIALVIIAILWAVSFLGSTPIFSEVVARSLYVSCLSCGPVPTSVAAYIYAAFYVFVFGVASFIMRIVFLIVTVCYVKQRTVPGNRENALGMTTFGFFLMLCNALNIIAQILPQLLAAIIVSPSVVSVEEYEVIAFEEGIYAVYALLALSLIPTPICMLILVSRLRQKLTSLFCCRKQEVDTSQSAGTMDTKEPSTQL